MNPYVFIVGCPRSGTTLLQRLLDAHPLLAIISETLWITREPDPRVGVTPEGYVTDELVCKLFGYPRFRRLGIRRDVIERLLAAESPLSYARFVSRIFDLYGETRGKALVGDKSPGYVRRVERLHAEWPEARFVHLIRDGRDVRLSVADWKKAPRVVGRFTTWTLDPVVTTALWWERSVRMGREAGAMLGPSLYSEVRYDDLVGDPQHLCREICTFLGLSFDQAMLGFHEGRQRKQGRAGAKKAWLPPTPGIRDWRTEMAHRDVERFEAAAGDLLDELGYVRGAPKPSPKVREYVAALRDGFADSLRSSGRPVPECWSTRGAPRAG